VLGRRESHEYQTPLFAEMASELGPAASYDLQGFTRLTSVSLHVDNDAAFPLPPSLEVLHISFKAGEQGLANPGMGPVSLPRLRSLQVHWTFTAGTRWLPFLVHSVEAVSMSSEPFGMCPLSPPHPRYRCWGHGWPTMVNVKTLVFRNIICPFDAAVQQVEELRLEGCATCVSSARSPHDVLRLFLSGKARRLHYLPQCVRCRTDKCSLGGIGWFGEEGWRGGPRITLKEVVSLAESPEFQPYLEVKCWRTPCKRWKIRAISKRNDSPCSTRPLS
jgi:hypothetical protein